MQKLQEYSTQGFASPFLAIESPPIGLFWHEEPRIRRQRFPDLIEQLLLDMLLEEILDLLHQMLEKPEVDVMQYILFEKKGNFDA